MELQPLIAQASRVHGNGLVHLIMESLATASSIRCDKTQSGTFVKLYKTVGEDSCRASRTSTPVTSTRASTSSPSCSMSATPPSLTRDALLSCRDSVPVLPCGDNGIRMQAIPVKNTFVHFPNAKHYDAARAASEPIPPGLESSNTGTFKDFYVGEDVCDSCTQTADETPGEICIPTLSTNAGFRTLNPAVVPRFMVLPSGGQFPVASTLDTAMTCTKTSFGTRSIGVNTGRPRRRTWGSQTDGLFESCIAGAPSSSAADFEPDDDNLRAYFEDKLDRIVEDKSNQLALRMEAKFRALSIT